MDLTRNQAKIITYLTSAQSTLLASTSWLQADVGAIRDTTGVTTIGSTTPTVHFPVPKDEKVSFLVNWVATAQDSSGTPALTVTAGGWRSALGDYRITLFDTSSGSTGAQHKQWIFGPFESAQFQSEATSTAGGCEVGDPSIRFTLSTAFATGALTTTHRYIVSIAPLRFPDVSYAT